MIKSYPKHPRIEDKAYLEFIRHEPCLVCEKGFYLKMLALSFIIDPHHPELTKFGGNLGGNVKADDKKAMPICRGHHTELGNLGEERFYKKYGIDPATEINRLQLKCEVENDLRKRQNRCHIKNAVFFSAIRDNAN